MEAPRVNICLDYSASLNENMNGSAQLGFGKPEDLSRFSLQYSKFVINHTKKNNKTPQFCTELHKVENGTVH